MTDPIAEAAAQLNQDAAPSSTEPSMLERAEETIHELEAKIEHLIHPGAVSLTIESVPHLDSAPVTTAEPMPEGDQGNVQAATDPSPPTESAANAGIPTALGDSATSAISPIPNETEAAAAEPVPASSDGSGSSQQSLSQQGLGTVEGGGEVTHVVAGSKSAGDAIRSHLAAIKHHLSVRGFELSLVADIHAELDAIERFL